MWKLVTEKEFDDFYHENVEHECHFSGALFNVPSTDFCFPKLKPGQTGAGAGAVAKAERVRWFRYEYYIDVESYVEMKV